MSREKKIDNLRRACVTCCSLLSNILYELKDFSKDEGREIVEILEFTSKLMHDLENYNLNFTKDRS